MRIDPNKTLAILVGVEKYEDKELHALPAASSNVLELSKLLNSRVGIPTSNICKIFDPKTGSDILKEIEDNIDPGVKKWDLVIFYYAGHGVKSDDQNQYYLGTQSIKPQRPGTYGVNVEQLIKEYLNTSPFLLILDCCFSGKSFDFAKSRFDFYIMASSSFRESTKYPLNEEFSAFANALTAVLKRKRKPSEKEETWLTIENIFTETDVRLVQMKFPKPTLLSKGTLGEMELVKCLEEEEQSNDALPDNTTKEEQSIAEILYSRLKSFDGTVIEARRSLTQSSDFQSALNRIVLDRYPYPIAYYLKSLLGKHTDTDETVFYKKLYEQIIKFLAFILIDDLVNNKDAYSVGKLVNLNLADVKAEDCLEILNLGCTKYSGTLFIKEFVVSARFLESAKALQDMLKDETAAIQDLQNKAVQFIASLAFLSRYTLVAVRNIVVQKGYYDPPNKFRHFNCILMSEIIEGYSGNLVLDDEYLHNGTILLLEKRKDKEGKIIVTSKGLNLWPLVVDANGFKEGSVKPCVYLFSRVDEEGEFEYEQLALKQAGDKKLYSDINELILQEEKEKYFEAFFNRLQAFF